MHQLTMRPDILTASGNYFDFMKPHESEFSIKDIAYSLSLIPYRIYAGLMGIAIDFIVLRSTQYWYQR